PTRDGDAEAGSVVSRLDIAVLVLELDRHGRVERDTGGGVDGLLPEYQLRGRVRADREAARRRAGQRQGGVAGLERIARARGVQHQVGKGSDAAIDLCRGNAAAGKGRTRRPAGDRDAHAGDAVPRLDVAVLVLDLHDH